MAQIVRLVGELTACCVYCWAMGKQSPPHLLMRCNQGRANGLDVEYVEFRNTVDFIKGSCWGCGSNLKVGVEDCYLKSSSLSWQLLHHIPGNKYATLVHKEKLPSRCAWRDVLKPLAYLVFTEPELRDAVSQMPQLPGFKSFSLDDWKDRLRDPTDNLILWVLGVIDSLRN